MAGTRVVDVFENSPAAPEAPNPRYLDALITKRQLYRFLLLVRDSARVTPNLLPDRVLEQIAHRWRFDQYLRELLASVVNMRRDDEPLHTQGYYAAHRLLLHGVSLSYLLDYLEQPEDELSSCWAPSDALVLTSDGRRIRALVCDCLGEQRIILPGHLDAWTRCALPRPHPIWTETVLDRLEHLINREDAREHDLQIFFEQYPEFIRGDLGASVSPQVILQSESGKRLRPDFIIKRADSTFVDILEIKRPIATLLSGTLERPTLAREVLMAVAQMREYGEWFNDPANRLRFRARYGIDGFEPKLSLVIGRRQAFPNDEVRARVTRGLGVNVLTYDDLVAMAKLRRLAAQPIGSQSIGPGK
jgi:Domain of unknown function (DUF4263)